MYVTQYSTTQFISNNVKKEPENLPFYFKPDLKNLKLEYKLTFNFMSLFS